MPRISSLASQGSTPPAPTDPKSTSGPPSPPVTAGNGLLQRYGVAPVNVEPLSGGVNYVVIHHPMGKHAAQISKEFPGIQEGQLVVKLVDGRYLAVAKVHLLAARQYWTHLDYASGDVLAVRTQKPSGESLLEEHIESLVLCYTPAGIVAAKAAWRKTRSPFAKAMAAALREREGHWYEFTGVAVVENRTNKKTGKAYTLLTATISPLNSDEAAVLTRWKEDPAVQAEFDKVAAAYEERLRYLDSKVR
jgi:hypothetical protein